MRAAVSSEPQATANEGRRIHSRSAFLCGILRHRVHFALPRRYYASAKLISDCRALARDEFDRELKVWANAYVEPARGVAKAEALLHYYAVTIGDDVTVQNLCEELGVTAVMPPAAYD